MPPTPGEPASPLDEFLRQYFEWCRTGSDDTEFVVGGPQTGFVQRLATARNLHLRWSTGRATKDRTKRQIEVELERGLEFVQNCRSPQLGWGLLSVIQKEVKHQDFHRRVAEVAERFEDEPGLGYLARHERARSLFDAGQTDAARKLYGELFLESVEFGFIPPFDAALRTAFRQGDGAQKWNKLLREAHSGLLAKQRLWTALVLSQRYRQMGDKTLADELFDDVLAQTDATERPDVVLSAVGHLRQTGRIGRADALLEPILKDDRFERSAFLWRLAADLAEKRHKPALSLRRLERAMDIEFTQTPDLVNLETVRRQYGELLNRYEKLVDAAATLETKPPKDLLARVVRFADRWRSLDTEDTAACQAAARIAGKLGERELAWDYLTTPVAMKPNEAAPWLSMARAQAGQNDFNLAGRAYTLAFAAEPTNAQILWDHHELLKRDGRWEEARALLRRLADGKWQPRFDRVRANARKALGTR